MYYYIFVFSITTLLGVFLDSIIAHNRSNPHFKIQRTWSCNILLLIFVVFVGFRAYTVGADTEIYVMKLEDAASMSLIDYLASRLYIEPFFNSWIWFCAKLTRVHSFFFFTCSLFYFWALLKFSIKTSKSIGWSVWLINSLGFMTLTLSTVRQSMAIAFCLLSYLSLEKNIKKSWLLFILALGTHMSSIVFFPMMFIKYFNKKYYAFVIVLLVGPVSFFGSMLMGDFSLMYATITEKSSYEEAVESVGGIGMIIFLAILLVFGFLTYFPIKKKKIPDTYYNEFVAVGLALAVFIISRFNLGTMRLYWYYLIFSIAYVPNVISKMNRSIRINAYLLVFSISCYYLFAKVMDSPYEESRLLLPYSFVWN